MEFKEMLYYIMNKPYFVVMVISKGRKVKKFVQLASSKEKGEDFFLISKALKCAWFKPDTPIIDGLKFITYVDLNNAIPLKIETIYEYEDNNLVIKETKKSKISVDEKKKSKENTGQPIKFVEISFPPTLLFQKVEAHFVKEILSVPPSKWEEIKWIFIALIVVAGIIIWNLINTTGGIAL